MYWDIDSPCIHCGCLYLMGNASRTRCCSSGSLAMHQIGDHRQRLKPLEPLEGTFLRLARLSEDSSEAHLECMAKLWEYNNSISVGVVCVDHGDSDDAARAAGVVARYNWDNPKFGDYCVKIQGRTFLMMKKEGHENGMDWVTLGNVGQALANSASLLQPLTEFITIPKLNLVPTFDGFRLFQAHTFETSVIRKCSISVTLAIRTGC